MHPAQGLPPNSCCVRPSQFHLHMAVPVPSFKNLSSFTVPAHDLKRWLSSKCKTEHLVPPMASFSVGIHLKRKMLTLSSWLREPMGEWVMIFYIKQWWSTILLCCHLEYLAQGQWNKERLKEQWTGNDAHITLHALVHENSTYEEATPTLR